MSDNPTEQLQAISQLRPQFDSAFNETFKRRVEWMAPFETKARQLKDKSEARRKDIGKMEHTLEATSRHLMRMRKEIVVAKNGGRKGETKKTPGVDCDDIRRSNPSAAGGF